MYQIYIKFDYLMFLNYASFCVLYFTQKLKLGKYRLFFLNGTKVLLNLTLTEILYFIFISKGHFVNKKYLAVLKALCKKSDVLSPV